jgi:hypothetical protein
MRVAVAIIVFAASVTAFATQEPDLDTVMARVTAYAAGFERRLSLLVAEEHYVQEVRREVATSDTPLSRQNPSGGFRNAPGRYEKRVLRSDYLLVRLVDDSGWMPFRDVFEVDGKKVRDREDRLASLFLKPSADSFDQARRITDDSSRYNIGSILRTINIPTLTVQFLVPKVTMRFEFARERMERVAGRQALRIAYTEIQRPTLIRTEHRRTAGVATLTDDDFPVHGKLWVDPATGVILKTTLAASDRFVATAITVTYREDATVGIWVPAQMEESYRAKGDARDITGLAKYDKYRRFHVSTDETIRKPSGN